MCARRMDVASLGSNDDGWLAPGRNVKEHSDIFDDSRVPIWVFEEEVSRWRMRHIHRTRPSVPYMSERCLWCHVQSSGRRQRTDKVVL
jgi:hypothetical protein